VSAAIVGGIAAAGAVGAAARFVVDGVLTARRPGPVPLAILLINVVGSFLLGLLTGLVEYHGLPHPWLAVLGTGFCGGFTTFSTASFAGVRLTQGGRHVLAAYYVLGTLGLCTAVAAGGLALASR
jgi:CrcB protein